MKRVIGFLLFWTAIGMALMLFIRNGFFGVCLILLFLSLGYKLFCD